MVAASNERIKGRDHSGRHPVLIHGFTVVSQRFARIDHPIEDAFALDEATGAIAVADGVTRDPALHLPDVREPEGWERFMSAYPRPSGARRAADIFCETVIEWARERSRDALDDTIEPPTRRRPRPAASPPLPDCFVEANRRIERLNRNENEPVDYLIHDFFGCVGAAVVELSAERFAYGVVSDCEVAVVDRSGGLKMRTGCVDLDQSRVARRELMQTLQLQWTHPAARYITRKYFRNNPAESASYGVLTGEPAALRHVRTGVEDKRADDLLLVFSDGVTPALFDASSRPQPAVTRLLQAYATDRDPSRLEAWFRERVQSEGTLVVSTAD